MKNKGIDDTRLSWNSKGLLWYILSRPIDWEIKTEELSLIYQGDQRGNGITSIYSMLGELKKFGYIKYTKSKNQSGHWQHRYEPSKRQE
jgi:hypothetical protein